MTLTRLLPAALMFSALLAGCGSGSSGGPQSTETPSTPGTDTSTTNQNKLMIIKGVAAYGLPLRGAAVTIIGRNSRGVIDTSATGVATGEDGSFSISVPASWKPPLLLEATANVGDRAVVLHSIFGDEFDTSASTQVINITPYTEAIFAAATGQHPATFYKAMQSSETADQLIANSSALAGLTKAQIDGKHISLRAAIAPLLQARNDKGEYLVTPTRPDNISLISTPFSANHTGLDKALDMTALYYSSDRTRLQLANKAAPASGVTVDITGKSISGSIGNQVADSIETINTLANELTTLYKSGVPSEAALGNYIASNYLNDGTDAQSLKSVLRASDYAGAQFSLNNVNAIYRDSSNVYRYEAIFKIRKTNGLAEFQQTTIARIDNRWQFIGNGHAAHSTILSYYSRNHDLNGNTFAAEPSSTGLIIRLEQPGPGNWFAKATVAGPGISDKVTLVKSNLTRDNNGVTSGCSILSLSATNCQNRIKFDRESDFNRDFGYEYAVSLYRNASDATPVQQFAVRLPTRPYLSTDPVTALSSLTAERILDKNTGATEASPTLAALRNYNGGDLPVYWRKGLANDTGYTYFIGLDIDICEQGQLTTRQAVTYGDYLDNAGNRTVTFSTRITEETNDYAYLRVFPALTGLEANIRRRDLRVFAQDENNRVYYASYTNATSVNCQ